MTLIWDFPQTLTAVWDYDNETEDIIKKYGTGKHYGGVALGINVDRNGYKAGIIPYSPKETELKAALAEHLGLSDCADPCDSFAEKFGGITRRQFIELAVERFRR